MKKMVICTWNVNGLRAEHSKSFLDWFAEQRPDILCLQETKAAADQLLAELREIECYGAFFASAERKGYSGVGLYSRPEPKAVRYG